MIWCVMKHNPMALIAQKARPALLALQDTALALLAQLAVHIRLGRYPAYQTFRLMDVEIVEHNSQAAGHRRGRYHRLDVRQKIDFGAGGTTRRCHNLATHHIATHNKRTGAVPNILIFSTLNLVRSHWQIGIFALQGLDASQFISTDCALALLCPCRCLTIDRTDITDFLIQLLISGRGQPIAYQMRFESPLFNSRASWRPEISLTM